jgi:archaellum component FlaC
MDEVDDVEHEVECVENEVEDVVRVDRVNIELEKKIKEKICKLYSLYRLVNQDIITINDRLTESTFITIRKRKILGARSHRNIGTERSNE